MKPPYLPIVDVDVDGWLCCSRCPVVLWLDFKFLWPLPPAHACSGWILRFHTKSQHKHTYTPCWNINFILCYFHPFRCPRLKPFVAPAWRAKKIPHLILYTLISCQKKRDNWLPPFLSLPLSFWTSSVPLNFVTSLHYSCRLSLPKSCLLGFLGVVYLDFKEKEKILFKKWKTFQQIEKSQKKLWKI